jgi:hypothetical protein
MRFLEQTLTDIIRRSMGLHRAEQPGVHYWDSGSYKDIHANPDKYAITTSQYAPGPGYESAGMTMRGYLGDDDANFYVFQKTPDRVAELRAEQTRLAKIAEEQYKAQSDDIAKQLKIVQGEKSSIAKMQQDYSNMLIAEAKRKKEAEDQAARDLQTQRANQAMAGRSGNLQIQPAGSAPRTGGTQQFRRRVLQQGTASPYKGLSTILSGMVNV